jgi:predicted CXXCH cytochrome family protein
MAISRNKVVRLTSLSVLTVALLFLCAKPMRAQAKNSCLDCHSVLPDELGVTPEKFSQDIHAQKGLTCESCHGGDESADDAEKAMSPKAGFRGKIDRKQIPQLCGGNCHSDPAAMRQFDPSLRIDQLSEYKTSIHGQRLAKGDTKVAVCIDCHSVHDIRPPSDPHSKVNPLNVATTCARCHADPHYMAAYKIPTNQFSEYSKSVHYEAMVARGDLSAPTCTTCHGNHGATPPDVTAVATVCSKCHVFQAQLFNSSPHKEVFASSGGCITCHSNHGIGHPTDEFIGTGAKSFCTQCHAEGDDGFVAAAKIKQDLDHLSVSIDRADEILGRAESSGMEVSQAKLDLTQARDSLVKVRVATHSADPRVVAVDIDAGLKTASADFAAGEKAMQERNYRRIGLGFSLVAIMLALVGLRLYIIQIERKA